MTDVPRGDGSWSVAELAIGGVVALLVLAGSGVWALGAIAGLLFGDGPPAVGMEQLPGVIGRLPGHLGDPREAWPRAARGSLPGPIGFVAGAVLLVGCVLSAAATVAAAGRRLKESVPTAARWGRSRELGGLRVSRAAAGRLVLGRHHGSLLAAEPRQSVIVVAPTQTGKTTGLAVPAILEWQGPVLATSIKTDLVADSLDRRRQMGEVMIFDPTAVTGHEPAHWTPLAGCRRWQGARETADRLCTVAKPGQGMSDADFWTSASARYLAPLLYAAANGDLSMADVVRWVDADDRDRPRQILAGLQYADSEEDRVAASAALAALTGVWEADDRLRSSLAATAGVALDAYGDPTVAATSSDVELTAEWLLSGSNTAYLCATATGQERLRPLFVTLIDQVVAHVYDLAARTGKPIDPPLLLVLDEAANIAPLPRLDQLAATGAGQGLQLVTVVQDLAQIESRWGRKADTIVNNHRAKLFGPGISCEKTLGYLTRVLGDEAIPQRSVTRGERGRKTTTDATTFRALAPADRLRQGKPGSGVLIYGNLPPARIDLRPWYRDPDLRRLAMAR